MVRRSSWQTKAAFCCPALRAIGIELDQIPALNRRPGRSPEWQIFVLPEATNDLTRHPIEPIILVGDFYFDGLVAREASRTSGLLKTVCEPPFEHLLGVKRANNGHHQGKQASHHGSIPPATNARQPGHLPSAGGPPAAAPVRHRRGMVPEPIAGCPVVVAALDQRADRLLRLHEPIEPAAGGSGARASSRWRTPLAAAGLACGVVRYLVSTNEPWGVASETSELSPTNTMIGYSSGCGVRPRSRSR